METREKDWNERREGKRRERDRKEKEEQERQVVLLGGGQGQVQQPPTCLSELPPRGSLPLSLSLALLSSGGAM